MRNKLNLFKLLLIFSIVLLNSSYLRAEVGSNGSFGTAFQISLPNGTGKAQPSLSLQYSSNAGNSIVGKGWMLTGLSYISRDPSKPIKYNGSDSFFHSELGQLVNIVNNIFHSKNESFTKLEPSGSCGDSYCQWIVTDKTGVKYYYGNTTNSRIGAKDKNGAIKTWALAKVEDRNGNYYEIQYTKDEDNGYYYPEIITYTKAAGISKYKTVEFEYDNRSDFRPNFIYGVRETITKRLKWIIVKSGGELVKKYGMD